MAKFKLLDKKRINSLPKTPGVYAFKQGRAFLYIGKAANIKQRVKNHFCKNGFKENLFLKEARKIGYLKTESEIEALVLEAGLIKKHQPKYNVMWKDDKNYFYVAVTKDDFPQVFITHQLPTTNYKPQTEHIGPFVDGRALRQTLRFLRRIFPYNTHKTLPKRPCLDYQLGLCPGACANPTAETRETAKRNADSLIKVLKGTKKKLITDLKKQMKEASKNQMFESAAKLRDQLMALKNIFQHAHILRELPEKRQLNWKQTERKLQQVLGTRTPIKRIEGYDVSNIQGKEASGSMVVFEKGVPNKKEYKKFKVKIAGRPDDTAMLKEVLSRRMQHPEWGMPQVMLIDGGKAQLNAVLKVKSQISNLKDIKTISLAKKHNELYIEGKKKPLLLKNLPQDVSNLILHLRDEAHRFAIGYHKRLRGKALLNNG